MRGVLWKFTAAQLYVTRCERCREALPAVSRGAALALHVGSAGNRPLAACGFTAGETTGAQLFSAN